MRFLSRSILTITGLGIFLFASVSATASGCKTSANLQRTACAFDLRDDYYTTVAHCQDSNNPDELCFEAAEEAFDEGREECRAVNLARRELCRSLENATHDPEFGPEYADNFVDPLTIGSEVSPNPWFALVPGNHWVYEGDGEVIDVVVTEKTKLIDGVTCLVVIDTASEDDVVIERTADWFAQDVEGNVWYCGEISENFEEFDGDETSGPELVDIDGSWKAGRDRAEPGILLPKVPTPGDFFRQEYAQSDAEDVIEILAIDASESSPGGACVDTCLQTRDFTPLDTDPDSTEHKFYVAGIGLIVEVKPGTDERVELVEFTGVGQ